MFIFNVGKVKVCTFGKVIDLCGCSLDGRNLAEVIHAYLLEHEWREMVDGWYMMVSSATGLGCNSEVVTSLIFIFCSCAALMCFCFNRHWDCTDLVLAG